MRNTRQLHLALILVALLGSTLRRVDGFLSTAGSKLIADRLQHCGVDAPLSMAFSRGSSNSNSRRRKKTVKDRTQQEVVGLVQDLVKTAMDAGPRAGPARTRDAIIAVSKTLREFLPQLSRSGSISTPVLLRTLFERLGATYVKLGQFIASSPTIFPKEYVTEFQKCLDQTEPLPWETVMRVIEGELGPISRTFSYVDQKPIGSASIAQVHAAKLKTGEDVVIKVQKPGIDDCLKADLGFIYGAARVLEFLQPDWERTSLASVAGDIRSSMLEELDFEKEAKNNVEFRLFLQENGLTNEATAPFIYPEFTTKKVLTMERLMGRSLLDKATVARMAENPQLGTNSIITALNIWTLSVNKMPWFHADVHSGNLLLLEDDRIGFIDFGIVGRIGDKVFQAVNELSAALAVNDSEGMARALCNMGAADKDIDTKQFGKDIERVLDRMMSVQPNVSVQETTDGRSIGRIDVDESEITNLVLELVEVTENNGLKLPREFGLLVKQTLYFDRYLKILAPNVDVMNDTRLSIGSTSSAERPKRVNGEQREFIDV